jgi:hypothetical protein
MCIFKLISFFTLQHGATEVMKKILKPSVNADIIDSKTFAVCDVFRSLLRFNRSKELAIELDIVGE